MRRARLAASAALLFLFTLAGMPAHSQPAVVAGEVLVGLVDGSDSGKVIGPLVSRQRKLRGLRAYRARLRPGLIPESAMAKLREHPAVTYVEPNWVRGLHAEPDDPSYSAAQYGPGRIQADRAWDIWKPMRTTVIAIVDTGIETGHADLANIVLRDAAGTAIGYNAIAPAVIPADDHGHGTHVAGIAAAEINNGIGIAGVAGWNPNIPGSSSYVKLMPIKVLNSAGSGNDADIAEGITWAVDHGANVISMSLGSPSFSATLNGAVQYAWSRGVVVIASAGNSGGAGKNYPAGFDNVLSVAATDSTDTLTYFSTVGSWVDIAAPGLSIYSTYRGQSYATMSGTSMSSPHVAGGAAALLAQNPFLTNAHVVDILRTHVDPYHPYSGRTLGPGAGLLNVFRAVKAAGDGTPVLTSIAASPADVTATLACQGTVYIGGPAPEGGLAVSLTSGDPGTVITPEAVLVPEGALSVSFPITSVPVSSPVEVSITAFAGSLTESTVITVRPPRVAALSLSPTAVTSPATLVGTIALDAAAAEGGVTVELSSDNPAVLNIPASVTIEAGQSTAVFSASAASVSGNVTVSVSAAANGGSATASALIKPPVILGVSVSPSSVVGGIVNSTGTVTLTGPAPADGALVTLSSNNAAASIPASVLVPEGAASATFSIATNRVTANATVSISGAYGGVSRAAYLTVLTLLKSVTLTPNSVTGGAAVTGRVDLNAPAPAEGFTVALSSTSGAALPPAHVPVAGGSVSSTFVISTAPVATAASAVISASVAGAVRTATLTVKPAAVSGITLNPTSVVGGFSSTGTVTLNGDAPAGGTLVQVTSNNAAAAAAGNILVPEGQRTAGFAVHTNVVSSNALATISASAGGVSRSAYLSIVPVSLQSFTVSPASVKGGTNSVATLTLTGPAPDGGAVISLSSNNASAALPASISIAAGQTTISVAVSTFPVTSNKLITLTATYRGASKSTTLGVTP